MSTAASVKNWLKGKTISAHPVINLKPLETLTVDFPPPKATFQGLHDSKPVIDFHPGSNPAHEIARLMEKAVAKVSPLYHGRSGCYFVRSWTAGKEEITAGCIMDAVILEMDGGEMIARRMIGKNLNNMSWGGLCATGVIPSKYLINQNSNAFGAIHVAQARNDQTAMPWSQISRDFAREVGYSHRAKVAA